jgi:hypothetical protein
MSMRSAISSLLVYAVLATPSIGQACAVCFTGRSDEQREAFINTTAFLTFLPLILLGAGITWFVRRVRRLEEEEVARRTGMLRIDA